MKMIIHLASALLLQVLGLAAMSGTTMAQETIVVPQQQTTQRICSLDAVADLLPAPPTQESNSFFAYLAEEGFIQSQEGGWVCYVNDPQKPDRYYTLFKVQEQDGQLIGTSFLENGNLIEGQESRSVDFFMTLVENHMNTSPENRQSVRRYLEAFLSLVKDQKIEASPRGFLFDQPNRALVMYHPLSTGELNGTAITINIQAPNNFGAGAVKSGIQPSLRERLKLSR
ncbi:hypothetical protein [Nodularia sphaerocarpa]|uniref:hypothetical protein n=1 Tax=Nodularia sphaerocarpa TaxID=137816 RepID=UPI001EFBDF45|nr:hypothetical protein [Nodularia sphaerocarpa]MDB9375843.1 hypothetical protein [Nodularia sphaerocarpa CS-585]MDB9379343.1 hypothetical protein [Nodularia sphaerocarpa CS-585A2]ULP71839.1 hypothetical protein BDGGKGIB_01475 [Nodularia sphaerocarpa UHCC 0038]